MTPSKQNQSQVAARDLKQKVLTCLHKLSDRDTHAAAAAELESIAKSLSADALPSFLSSITATDSSDKSAVRKQCVNLIYVLALHHGNSLAPYISKLLSGVLRRLRDSDSGVRTACVSAVSAIAAHVTRPSFSTISKPFLEALFTEQDLNSQIGTAMCLSAAIEAAEEPDLVLLRKALARFEKLVKCEGFKAKAAVLALIGSVIEVGAVAGSKQIVENLLPCLVEVLSSEDWAVRKAAGEALTKIALVEKDTLPDFKATCLKTFETRKFDKVKAVRETLTQMVEVWKEVPESFDEISVPPPDPQSYSKENSSDAHYSPGSRASCTITSGAQQLRKKLPSNKSPLHDSSSATTARKNSPVNSIEKKVGPAMFRKLDRKKPSDLKVNMSTSGGHDTINYEDVETNSIEEALDKGESKIRLTKPGVKGTIFAKDGSRVVPIQEEKSESIVVVSNETGNIGNLKECEDLSVIRQQLLQIENQQNNLLELLQRFMGSSQNGMHSLETRVHGLELTLDEISLDLAMSGRMSNTDSAGGMCCKLPGAEFLSSKLWRRAESQFANSQFSATGAAPMAVLMHNRGNKCRDPASFKLENRRSGFQGGRGIMMSPPAESYRDLHGVSEVPLTRVSNIVPPA